MKRKYLSALLMGTLTVASVSTMTSCKDYDDDINGLSTEITNNATKLDKLVEEKVQNLTKELTTLKEQQSALESALSTAKGDLNTAIEAAKTDAKKYADVQAEAAKVAAIDAAKKNVEDAINVVNASLDQVKASIDDLNSKVTTNEEKIAGLLQADADLQKAIDVVAADAKAAADAAAAAQKTADANAQTIAKVVEDLLKVEKDMKDQIAVVAGDVQKNAEAIAQQKADVDNQLAQVNKLIEANNKAIEELKGVDANLDKKLDAQAKELKKVADELSNLQAQVTANLKTAQDYTDTQVAALKLALGEDINKVKADLAGALTDIAKQGELIKKLQTAQGTLTENLKTANKLINDNHNAMLAEVAKVAGDLTRIQGELTVKIDANKADIGKLQTLADNIKTLAEQNKADIATLKSDIATLKDEFNKYVTTETLGTYKLAVTDEIKKAVDKMAQDLRTEIGLVKGDDTTVKTIQGQIDDINEELKKFANASDVAELQTAFSELTEQLTNKFFVIDMSISEINNKIDNIIADYKVVVGDLAGVARQLKALVFSPEAYWQGIEAIDVNSFEYNAKQVAAADLDKDQTSDAPASFTPNVAIQVVPEVRASYFLNPSNAAVDFDASKYSFIVNNAKVSRASSSDIKVSKVEAGDAVGKINVYFNMADATKLLNGTQENGYKVDVAALRYKYCTKEGAKDTIVTSDFAALKKYRISGFSLRKVATEGTVDKADAVCIKLAKKAADALASTAPTLSVAYKDDAESGSKKTIDLDKWIDVHYSINSAAPTLWGGQETVNKKNFHLEYETIGYITGANNTNESKHAKLSGEHGHILEAVGVNNENGRQIIGRTPLLRVKLVDDNSKKIAAVGYIKVVIEDIAQKPITIEDKFNADKVYTVGCSGDDVLGYKTTWDQIENEVLADLDMSKSEFEGTYKLDATSETSSIANQYMIDANGKFVANTDACGTIKYSATDPASHETNILTWSITGGDAYKYFITEKKTKLETWIKFTPKNATTAQLKDIYVKFVWNVSKVNSTPEATILDSDKKAAAWHAANKNTAGFDQLHIQVGNATDPTAACEFHNLVVANTFNSDLKTIVKNQIEGQYPALANALTVSYKFAKTSEQSHKSYIGVAEEHKYNITVNNDGSEIMADGTVIARINATDGTISVEKNSTTMDILNKYGKVSELEDALTFTVLAEVKTCKPAADIVNLTNKKFDVKVIKPLFVESVKVNNMTLNNFASLTQDVTFNFVDFNNYTQQKFWANSNSRMAFWKFYGIKSIKKAGTITTNYSGAWKKIDENDIKVTYTDMTSFTPNSNGVVTDMGKVTLTQVNQSRANGFDVKVPVEIEYNWGTLKTDIKFHVNPATAAAKKH